MMNLYLSHYKKKYNDFFSGGRFDLFVIIKIFLVKVTQYRLFSIFINTTCLKKNKSNS